MRLSGQGQRPMEFYDSVTGKLLFTAPIGRSMEDFLIESSAHGWPSFRDEEVRRLLIYENSFFAEQHSSLTNDSWLSSFLINIIIKVNWENVRCLPDGETVSTTGTHLGHNLPDQKGSRYCINLVSVAGKKVGK